MKKIVLLSLSAIVLIGIIGFGLSQNFKAKNVLGIEEAQARAEKFINENLLADGYTAEIKAVKEDGDLYSIELVVAGQEYTSYMTKDGKKFFSSGIDIEAIEEAKQEAENSQSNAASVPNKSDRPKVELFVMSHCPYGTQIEKSILPVVELLQDKIDFELKFCDYAMHGQTELNEQLSQYCIQEQGLDKLLVYLNCFLADGDSQGCLTEIDIDRNALASCVSQTDNQYGVTASYNDQNTWLKNSAGNPAYPIFTVYQADNDNYGISGSPTLVINGSTIQSGRDSASLLATVCSAFNSQPEICGAQLSSAVPASGFGFEGSGSDTTATCN
jgi:glutaredoxin